MKFFILLLLMGMFFSQAGNATYLNSNASWNTSFYGSKWVSLASGDIDNDGFPDLIHIGCAAGTPCSSYLAKVYINNRTSFIENSTWQSNLTGVNYGSVALGDIDNDGDLDLALSGCTNGGGSVSACLEVFSAIYINNGTSFAENSYWKGDLQNAWKSSFAFGDIDLDGKLDLILSGSGSPMVKVLLNNGTSFKESTTWGQTLIGVLGGSATLSDPDNDGDLDLFLVGDKGSGQGHSAKAYTNNGTSFIENSTWQASLLAVELSSAVWGDIDNDGDMDFSLIGHTSSDEHSLFNNTGNGLIEINKRAPFGSLRGIFEGTQSLGDYNNDGKLDLFTSGEEEWSTFYLNTGANFTGAIDDPESHIFNTAYGPGSVLVDLENDGTLDLILIGLNKDINDWGRDVYTNNITTKNTAPLPPSTLSANYSNGILNLSWSMGTDTETPALGLYYNLRVGSSSGGHQIVTGVYGGGDDTGYFGNMMQRRNILLRLPNLTGTIYWSVQTIDTGLKAGSWAAERTLTINATNSSNQTTDTTMPNVSISSPVSGSTLTTSSVVVSATFADVSNTTCNNRLNSNSYVAMTTSGPKNGTATYTFTAVANGLHTITVNCTDIYGNSRTNSTSFFVSLSAPPAGGSGGGGGGGGGGGAPQANTTQNSTQNQTTVETTTGEIEPGEVRIVEIQNSAITKISMEVNESVGAVTFKAEQVDTPLEVPSANVYRFIEISHSNLSDTNVKTASISFVVEKSWITDNSINKSTVRLNRYDNGWTALNTTLLTENSTSITYEAVSPGFSLFAITGEKVIDIKPDFSGYYVYGAILVLIIAGVGGYWYHKKLHPSGATQPASVNV